MTRGGGELSDNDIKIAAEAHAKMQKRLQEQKAVNAAAEQKRLADIAAQAQRNKAAAEAVYGEKR